MSNEHEKRYLKWWKEQLKKAYIEGYSDGMEALRESEISADRWAQVLVDSAIEEEDSE